MTDRYAVLGNPIAHSKSPRIHRLFADQTGQDLDYAAKLVELDQFAATIKQMMAEGFCGCNVTVPFKLEAFQLAQQLTPRAQAAEAVNTLIFRNQQIIGDNTDGAGLVRDITVNQQFPLQHQRVLLLGAGGAAQGVILPILEQQPAQLVISNRTLSKAQQLQAKLAPQGQACSFEQLAGQQFDVVINATSAGLSDQQLPLPAGLFAPNSLAYDMMYGRETPFMALARQQNQVRVVDGLGMLVEQAAEAFALWRGVRPTTESVIQQLRT